MNILFIIPLLGVVLAAPMPDEKSPIVKRAMETIMFGNQQNSNKQVKKSDPSVSIRDTLPDVNAPVLPDLGGAVEASKAEDIAEVKSDKESEITADELESFDKGELSKDSEEELASEVDLKQESEEDSKISPEDAAAIQELEKNINSDESTEDNTAVQSSDDNSLSNDSEYESPYDLYQLYKQYQNMLSQDPNYYYGYRRRRRAIQKRRFMGKLKGRAIKRAHRNKRDLTYPDESEYEPLYYPDMPYSDSDAYGLYENPYETEAMPQNEMNPLEELLEENEEFQSPYSQYEPPSWLYEYIPRGYEDAYKPVKRQSMLSFVPGNRKRSSYFYPVNEEPETHFGAFVPEKRDYFQSYGNLVRAARLLAAKQEERDSLQGYPEWYR